MACDEITGKIAYLTAADLMYSLEAQGLNCFAVRLGCPLGLLFTTY